jgi:hypothetical protein
VCGPASLVGTSSKLSRSYAYQRRTVPPNSLTSTLSPCELILIRLQMQPLQGRASPLTTPAQCDTLHCLLYETSSRIATVAVMLDAGLPYVAIASTELYEEPRKAEEISSSMLRIMHFNHRYSAILRKAYPGKASNLFQRKLCLSTYDASRYRSFREISKGVCPSRTRRRRIGGKGEEETQETQGSRRETSASQSHKNREARCEKRRMRTSSSLSTKSSKKLTSFDALRFPRLLHYHEGKIG